MTDLYLKTYHEQQTQEILNCKSWFSRSLCGIGIGLNANNKFQFKQLL